jgi:hypothetical protein
MIPLVEAYLVLELLPLLHVVEGSSKPSLIPLANRAKDPTNGANFGPRRDLFGSTSYSSELEPAPTELYETDLM